MRMSNQSAVRLSIASVLLLAACSSGGGSGDGDPGGATSPTALADGGSATFLFPAAPLDLDPSTSQDNNASMPMWNAWFEYLATPGENGFEPMLATDWTTSEDGRTYTFTLDHEGVFSDGSPVTAQDVVFSLQRNMKPEVSLLNFLTAKIARLEAVDEETVRIVLKEPWPHLVADLASPTAAIYSQKALEATSPKTFFNTAPVGSGPFTLEDVVPNSSYTLARNEKYWRPDDAAQLDQLEFQVVTDETARLSAVQGGRADIAQSPPANQVEGLKSSSGVRVETFPSSRVDLIVLNTTQPPFDNQELRQAFSLALDRQAMVDTGLFGLGEVAKTFLVSPPELTFQNPQLDLYPHDVDKARQLVEESGVSTPISFPLEVSTGSAQEAILTVAQQNLEEIGFSVTPVRKDPASVDNDIIGQKYTANTTFWGNITADPSVQPQFALDPNYCCGAYFSGYNDQGLIDLVQQAINETDPDKAQQLFDEVQTEAADAAFLVPLYYPELTYVLSSKIGGFSANPFGFYDWAAIGRSS